MSESREPWPGAFDAYDREVMPDDAIRAALNYRTPDVLLSPSTVREIARLMVSDPDGRLFLAVLLAPVIAGLALLGVLVALTRGGCSP